MSKTGYPVNTRRLFYACKTSVNLIEVATLYRRLIVVGKTSCVYRVFRFTHYLQTSRANNSRILMIKNANFSGYCFYMNTNVWVDFQICISVPLIGVHKNFTVFTGKHLWQSLFINKVEHLFKNAPGGCFSNLNCWTLFGSEMEMVDHEPLFFSH